MVDYKLWCFGVLSLQAMEQATWLMHWWDLLQGWNIEQLWQWQRQMQGGTSRPQRKKLYDQNINSVEYISLLQPLHDYKVKFA